MSSVKSHLLDPLNAMFKLALLNMCEPGTRLSINNHVVTIQRKPYIPIMQGVMRYISGDDVNDLHLFERPIIKIVEWYITEYIEQPMSTDEDIIISDEKTDIIPEKKDSLNTSRHKKNKKGKNDDIDVIPEKKEIKDVKDVKGTKETDNFNNKIIIKKIKNKFYKNKELKELMMFACKGLERLQTFYESIYGDGMFMLGIQEMINTLQEGMNGQLYIEKLPVNYRKLDTISLIHIQNILIYWKDDKIKEMLKNLKLSEDHINDEKSKDLSVDPSSNDILNNKGLRKILDGYIDSILSVLIPLDNEFVKLVKKSYM